MADPKRPELTLAVVAGASVPLLAALLSPAVLTLAGSTGLPLGQVLAAAGRFQVLLIPAAGVFGSLLSGLAIALCARTGRIPSTLAILAATLPWWAGSLLTRSGIRSVLEAVTAAQPSDLPLLLAAGTGEAQLNWMLGTATAACVFAGVAVGFGVAARRAREVHPGEVRSFWGGAVVAAGVAVWTAGLAYAAAAASRALIRLPQLEAPARATAAVSDGLEPQQTAQRVVLLGMILAALGTVLWVSNAALRWKGWHLSAAGLLAAAAVLGAMFFDHASARTAHEVARRQLQAWTLPPGLTLPQGGGQSGAPPPTLIATAQAALIGDQQVGWDALSTAAGSLPFERWSIAADGALPAPALRKLLEAAEAHRVRELVILLGARPEEKAALEDLEQVSPLMAAAAWDRRGVPVKLPASLQDLEPEAIRPAQPEGDGLRVERPAGLYRLSDPPGGLGALTAVVLRPPPELTLPQLIALAALAEHHGTRLAVTTR